MIRDRVRSARGIAAAALIAIAATFLRGAAPPPVDGAQTDLSYTSAAVWTVDPAHGRVHVLLNVNATSHAADSGGRRYFYPGLQLTLPLSTAEYAALDGNGQSLPLSVIATTPSGVVVNVGFRQPLYSGQSGAFELKFDLVDRGGSTDRDLRIGQDIVSFPVSAFGSPGASGGSVTVVFPADLIVQEQFGALATSTDSFGQTVFSSGPVADSTALNAWFTASRTVPASDFRVLQVVVGPIDATLRYWADDPGWADQVARVLQSGYPVLSELIGLGDPASKSLTIEEATTQGIGGFSGEYDPAASMVRVSYFADPIVVLHEVAHMWFNNDLASGRWIDEGFASFYAEQAVLRLGLPDHAPALSTSLMRAAIPLNDWTDAGAPGTPTEAYLYGASLAAVRQIAALAGTDGLRKVWAEAQAGTNAYPQPGANSAVLQGGVTEWRRLLDLLEQTTGQSYTAIWRQWVVTSAEAATLHDRDSARADYASTEAAAGGWILPPDAQSAMSGWDFGTATALLGQVRTVLTMRRQIDDAAPNEDTTPPATLRTIFERVGTAAALAEAEQELAALDSLSAARRAQANSEGAARAVGLLGIDPEADLASARKVFAAGDIATAHSLAESARSAWAGATGVGQVRILGTAAGTAGVLLLIALFIWTRSGRRKENKRSSVATSPTEQRDA
jgi:hypothetical protein